MAKTRSESMSSFGAESPSSKPSDAVNVSPVSSVPNAPSDVATQEEIASKSSTTAAATQPQVRLYFTYKDDEAEAEVRGLATDLHARGIRSAIPSQSLLQLGRVPAGIDSWDREVDQSIDASDVVVIVAGTSYGTWAEKEAPSDQPPERSLSQVVFEKTIARGKRLLCVLTPGGIESAEPAQAAFIQSIQRTARRLPFDAQTQDQSQKAWWIDLPSDPEPQQAFHDRIVDVLVGWCTREAVPAAKPKRGPDGLQAISTRMISDSPVDHDEDDLLDYRVYADALASLIDNPQTLTPLTIAINAPWGAGKSSLANLVSRRLSSKPAAGGVTPHVVCWFNAWMHDDAENLGGSLVAEVAQVADKHRTPWRRWLLPLPMGLRPVSERFGRQTARFLWLLAMTAVLAITVFTIKHRSKAADALSPVAKAPQQLARVLSSAPEQPPTTQANASAEQTDKQDKSDVLKWLALFGACGTPLAGFWLVIENSWKVASAVAEFVRSPQSEAGSGSMCKVREQLGKLIEQGTPRGSRFVIFIDDLERCRPPKAMDVLEAVSQLLCHKDVVVVLLADVSALAINAEIKYETLASKYSPAVPPSPGAEEAATQPFGRLYLQKFIQLQFDLPQTSIGQMREYVQHLAEERKAAPVMSNTMQKPTRTQRLVAVVKDPMEFAWTTQSHPILSSLGIRWGSSRIVSGVWKFFAMTFLPVWWLAIVSIRAGYPVRERLTVGRRILKFRLASYVSLLLGLGVELCVSISVIMIVAVIVAFWTRSEDLGGYIFATVFTLFLVMGSGSALFLSLYLPAQKQYTRDAARLRGFRNDVLSELQNPNGPPSMTPADVTPQAELSPAVMESIRREQQAIFLQNESQLFTDARDAVITQLPPIPRHVKRVLNRLRLIIMIMYARNLFKDDDFDGRCVGKWIAIQERWPELATRVTRNPGLMSTMESLAELSPGDSPAEVDLAFKHFCNRLKPLLPGTFAIERDLYTLLCDSPKLSHWVGRMTLFNRD